jgi:CDP-glucose 4,6-dehydratase
VDERVRPLESVAVTDFWRDRPVLVTGATGFLGGWLVRELVARRAAVVCLVRDWVGQCELLRPGASQQVTLVRGDVRSQASIERVLGDYEIDTVFHLAAQAVVGVASRNPPSTLDTNIRGTWSVLEACRRSPQVRQIVVASSDKAYGAHDTLPYHEQTALQGRYPYDVSKSCADLIAQSYAATYALPVIISRCANLYGGSDLNWNRLVPGTIRSVLRGERPIVRSDGQRLRDYLYIEDAVSAYVVLAEALGAGRVRPGMAFNFGHRNPITVVAFVERILAACCRPDLVPDIRGNAPHEIPDQYLDPSQATAMLGWEAQYSHEEGLTRTLEWYRNFLADVLPQ